MSQRIKLNNGEIKTISSKQKANETESDNHQKIQKKKSN